MNKLKLMDKFKLVDTRSLWVKHSPCVFALLKLANITNFQFCCFLQVGELESHWKACGYWCTKVWELFYFQGTIAIHHLLRELTLINLLHEVAVVSREEKQQLVPQYGYPSYVYNDNPSCAIYNFLLLPLCDYCFSGQASSLIVQLALMSPNLVFYQSMRHQIYLFSRWL